MSCTAPDHTTASVMTTASVSQPRQCVTPVSTMSRTVNAAGTTPTITFAAVRAFGSYRPMAVRSSALTPLASHGAVDIVPHHGGGVDPAPMNDVPPHSVVPRMSSDRSTSSRSVYGEYSVGAGGIAAGGGGVTG